MAIRNEKTVSASSIRCLVSASPTDQFTDDDLDAPLFMTQELEELHEIRNYTATDTA